MPSKGLRGGPSPGPTKAQLLLLATLDRPPAGLPLWCGPSSPAPFSINTCLRSACLQSSRRQALWGTPHKSLSIADDNRNICELIIKACLADFAAVPHVVSHDCQSSHNGRQRQGAHNPKRNAPQVRCTCIRACSVRTCEPCKITPQRAPV